MTELLERAIAQLKALPDEEQDAIASRLLAEMEDEQTWKAQFESTTDDQWDRMADMGRKILVVGVARRILQKLYVSAHSLLFHKPVS